MLFDTSFWIRTDFRYHWGQNNSFLKNVFSAVKMFMLYYSVPQPFNLHNTGRMYHICLPLWCCYVKNTTTTYGENIQLGIFWGTTSHTVQHFLLLLLSIKREMRAMLIEWCNHQGSDYNNQSWQLQPLLCCHGTGPEAEWMLLNKFLEHTRIF